MAIFVHFLHVKCQYLLNNDPDMVNYDSNNKNIYLFFIDQI